MQAVLIMMVGLLIIAAVIGVGVFVAIRAANRSTQRSEGWQPPPPDGSPR